MVFDFRSDIWVSKWGLEAQIKCMTADEINECDNGTHDCDENAECVPTSNSSYVCKCPDSKWGNDEIVARGTGTKSDPCFWVTPFNEWQQMHPIKVRVQYTFSSFFSFFDRQSLLTRFSLMAETLSR